MERPLSPPRPLQPTSKNYCTNLDELLPSVDNLFLEAEDDRDATEDIIFEEFHRDSFLRSYADPGKFTEEFERTIQAIRKETGVSDSLLHEEAAIVEILERKPTTPSPNASFNDNRGTPIEVEEQRDQRDDTSVSSSESNFWKLLLANSSSNFQVSPPIFDAFDQKEKHWLERPAVPWEELEASRKKCKQWLDKKK